MTTSFDMDPPRWCRLALTAEELDVLRWALGYALDAPEQIPPARVIACQLVRDKLPAVKA